VSPARAGTVIVGGGVIGCAVASALARAGARDVVLLERRRLTHGATWHAAGLVGQLRSSLGLTRLMRESVALYTSLEKDTGQATGWHGVGSLRVAASEARMREIERQVARAAGFGLEAHLVSPAEARRLCPPLAVDGLVGAAWIPADGHADPASVTQALAKDARDRGVAIREGVRVTGFRRAGDRVAAVAMTDGEIAAETVVLAGGMWSRALAAPLGLNLAVCAVEHQYLVTEPIAGLPADVPVLRDPDAAFYMKPEVGGLAVGGWDELPPVFGAGGIREDFGPELLPPDHDRFQSLAEAAIRRLPCLGTAGVKDLVNGPIPITADGEPLLGPAPGFANLWLACGFTSGIAAGGGAGAALARWIRDGDPGCDLAPLSPTRFPAMDDATLHARARRAYSDYYALSAS
jgi:4-methylaminobutanoate oxidase (formaldehyde-forming)